MGPRCPRHAPGVDEILFDDLARRGVEVLNAIIQGARFVMRVAVPKPTAFEGVGDGLLEIDPVDDIAMIAGTGGTTGQPKGVMLSGRNLEAMSALTLMSYPFDGRPVYLALAPLTHAAGVLCLPIMTLGGRIVIMSKADLREFLRLVAHRRVTHTFLPPTLIYMLLEYPALPAADL